MTGEEATRHAGRLFATQPVTPADVEVLAAFLSREAAHGLGNGQTLAGAGVIILLEGALRAAGVRLKAPALAGPLAPTQTAPAAWVAEGSATVIALDADRHRALMTESSPEAERYRWVVLASLTDRVAHMSDLIRRLGAGEAAPQNLLGATDAIAAGGEPAP